MTLKQRLYLKVRHILVFYHKIKLRNFLRTFHCVKIFTFLMRNFRCYNLDCVNKITFSTPAKCHIIIKETRRRSGGPQSYQELPKKLEYIEWPHIRETTQDFVYCLTIVTIIPFFLGFWANPPINWQLKILMSSKFVCAILWTTLTRK